MIIISLTYVKSAEEADRHMEEHMTWLKSGYAKKIFLASGRKVPRTGGVIFAHGDRKEIEVFVDQDPFKIHGVAEYDMTEVNLTTTAEGLEGLKG